MVNWAMRDFQQEGITGSLVGYVDGKTSGPRVEVRRSQGGHYQFISLCPGCQWARLKQTERRAKKTLFQHLRTHRNGELRLMTQASRKNSGLALERLEKSARKGRKYGQTRSSAGPLENQFNSSGACGGRLALCDLQKESDRQTGNGNANDRSGTAYLPR